MGGRDRRRQPGKCGTRRAPTAARCWLRGLPPGGARAAAPQPLPNPGPRPCRSAVSLARMTRESLYRRRIFLAASPRVLPARPLRARESHLLEHASCSPQSRGAGPSGGNGPPARPAAQRRPCAWPPAKRPLPQGESALDSGFSVGCKAGETPALGPWLTQGAGREALRDSAGHRKTRPGESGAHAPAAGRARGAPPSGHLLTPGAARLGVSRPEQKGARSGSAIL